MNDITLENGYTRFYRSFDIHRIYPSEFVVRIFKGSYPRLKLGQEPLRGKKICDIGCGDGRNIILLHEIGLEVFGTEITPEIVEKVSRELHRINITADIRVGKNNQLPFPESSFDFLLSWNSCYYMGIPENHHSFDQYVSEFSRVLKPGGRLILSVPMPSCFIFSGSRPFKPGYREITDDPYLIRNGQVFKVFENVQQIESEFSTLFTHFVFASIVDDCFGLDNHWFITICQKRSS